MDEGGPLFELAYVSASAAGAHEAILGFDADLTLDEALDGFARLAETIEVARLSPRPRGRAEGERVRDVAPSP